MDQSNIEILTSFITHLPMYVYPVSRYTIVSYVDGFEAGIRSREFSNTLDEYMKDHYGVRGSGGGWPHQVQQLSEVWNLTWDGAFVKVADKVLTSLN